MVHNLTGGGAERVAALWASGFAERGDSVKLLIQEPTDSKYSISERVSIVSLSSNISNRIIAGILSRLGLSRRSYLKKLNKFLHVEKPDIFIGVMGPYARDAYAMSRDLEMTVIQSYHSSFDLPFNAPDNRRKDIEVCYSKDKAVPFRTVLTKADKEFIGDRMRNVFVMPNPLAFEPLLSVPPKHKYILACGRLDVWDVKGFDILIQAWAMIANKHTSWRLRIAGDGSIKSKDLLLNMVKEYHLTDRVEFLGFRNDIVELYKESEIFVLSSRYEGFGMVLVEAMSQGCACVACDYKGRQKEIIEDSSQGLICDTDDVKSLSCALDKMIEDGDYRKKCQENSLKRASYFSVLNTIGRWESIFQSIGVI